MFNSELNSNLGLPDEVVLELQCNASNAVPANGYARATILPQYKYVTIEHISGANIGNFMIDGVLHNEYITANHMELPESDAPRIFTIRSTDGYNIAHFTLK